MEKSNDSNGVNIEKSIIQVIQDLVYVKDIDCRVTWINPSALAALGLSSPEEILGKLPNEVFTRESAEKILRDDRHVITTGQVQTFEETITLPNGDKRVYQTTKTPHVDATGKIIGIIGISRDITKNKQIEDILKNSEVRFRSTFEQSPFSTQLLSADGRTISVNPAWKQLWQIDQDSIDHFILKDYRILEDQQLVKKGIMPFIKLGFAGNIVEIPPILYDPQEMGLSGRPRWVEGHIYPVMDPYGYIQHLVLTHNDVSDLRLAEERFRLIFEYSPVALIMSDKNGLISALNSKAESLFGYERSELIGKSIDVLLPDRFRKGHIEQRKAYFNNPITRPMGAGRDLFALRKDGTEISVEIALTPIYSESEQFVLSSIIDVTERKLAESEKEALYKKTQEAIQIRDNFLMVASHELKTPLTSLGIQVQLLIQMAEQGTLATLTKEKALELFKVSKQQLERFASLIDSLLDVSRISVGRLPLYIEDVNLSELIRDLITRYSIELNRTGCSINLLLDDAIVGRWDRLRIEQVFSNIITNAMKYGAGKPIEITTKIISDRVIISIQDQGIGIANEDLARIFDRFERAVSARYFGGLGLGLYITRQIVEAHGGTISVESKIGKGSKFKVDLPIQSSESK